MPAEFKYIYVICWPGGPYWEKLCPRSWVQPEATGWRPYWRPWGKFFPIWTDQGRQITYLIFFCTVLLWKQLLCWILIKAIQFKSGLSVCLTFWAEKAILFAEFVGLIHNNVWLCVECLHFICFYVVIKCLKVGHFGVVCTRGLDGKNRTAGAFAISKSDSRI